MSVSVYVVLWIQCGVIFYLSVLLLRLEFMAALMIYTNKNSSLSFACLSHIFSISSHLACPDQFYVRLD